MARREQILKRRVGLLLALMAPACCPASCCPPCEVRAPEGNPGDTYEFAVTELRYDAGPWDANPTAGNIAGSIMIPAHTTTPVHGPVYVGSSGAKLAGSGRLPIVFLVHGMSVAPPASYLGYWPLQFALAARGIIAVSVRMDTSSTLTDEDWANRLLANIDHFKALDATPYGMFEGRIDFDRIGLMGHSRGGGAVVEIPQMLPSSNEVRAIVMLAASAGNRDSEDWSSISGIPLLTVLPAAEGVGDGSYRDGNPFYTAPGFPHLPSAKAWEKRDADPFKVQLYVHHANHNSWNSNWSPKDGAPTPDDVFSRRHHDLILNAYAGAFFGFFLQQWQPSLAESEERELFRSELGDIAYLNGTKVPEIYRPASYSTGAYAETRVDPNDLHLSWVSRRMLVVDDFETVGMTVNSLGGAVSVTGLTASEGAVSYDAGNPAKRLVLSQNSCDPATAPCTGAIRTELPQMSRDVFPWKSVLVRVAENYAVSLPMEAVAFELGLELANGEVSWVHSDKAGGVARPYVRQDAAQRILLETLRFPLHCFGTTYVEQRNDIVAIHLRPQTTTGRAVAFDHLALE